MTIEVGEVFAVNGIKVTLKIFEESNQDSVTFEGNKYRGVSVREYIAIRRGTRDIICLIESDSLDESKIEKNGFSRKVVAKPIGYFEEGHFFEGIKFLPLLKDPAHLLPESKISEIYSRNQDKNFVIGEMLKEGIPISLPWDKLFNTHIGIFGNTGSGKTNTLVKLYTTLFEQKINAIEQNSRFILLDFNGEYTSGQIAAARHKTILHLSTEGTTGQDKFTLSQDEFWDPEMLNILFQAKPYTETPFLNRVVNGRKKYGRGTSADDLLNYLKRTFKAVFTSASPRGEALDLLRNIASFLDLKDVQEAMKAISWNGNTEKFCTNSGASFDGLVYENVLSEVVNAIRFRNLDVFDELSLMCDLRFITDLIHGYVQFDHIQPLIKRMEVSITALRKVLKIEPARKVLKPLTVISLRKCNQDIKNVLPLLIAKHYYYLHKNSVAIPADKTIHLIIDEAHNILSYEPSSGQESWKEHRLKLFEEIIKEGRKFGMYITLASQRPADISPTIISQVHNFFIHRLVNDRDLALLDNAINTLDGLSKSLIPSLSKGSCIVTGSSFDLPMVIQVKKLEQNKRPNSDDVDLEKLWS